MKHLCAATLLFLTMYSCTEKNAYVQKANDDYNIVADNDTVESGKGLLVSKELLNMTELKEKYEEGATSTKLNKANTTLYMNPNSKGYFGRYIFSDYINDDLYRVGSLTVFNNETPWMYNNVNDVFIELTATQPGISIFDDIQVGTEISTIKEQLGEPSINEDSLIAYKNEDSLWIALFKVEEKRVKSYKLGRYKDEIVKNIQKYKDKLLKNF